MLFLLTFVSDIAIFVLKGDVKLQLTNYAVSLLLHCHIIARIYGWNFVGMKS